MFCPNCGNSDVKEETDHYYKNDLGFDYQCNWCDHRFFLSADEEVFYGLIAFCIEHKKLPGNILVPGDWYRLLNDNILELFKKLRISLTKDEEIQSLVLIAN